MALAAEPASGVKEVVASFAAWLDKHGDEVAGLKSHPSGDLVEAVAQVQPAMRVLSDAGWLRLGWPEWAGGIGGSPVQRAAVLEALAAAGYVVPEFIATPEIVGPMLVRYAPALAARDLAAALCGDEVWCQGFSEPEAGSDLGSLRTRAVLDGDAFVLSGQKMWSSFGHVSRRCSLLARTGEPDSGYRGLTMFWLDLKSPGVTVVPTACASGRAETAEIFLDDVRVPAGQVVGQVGGGWEAVMYLLQFERGAYAWLRQAEMLTGLGALLGRAAGSPGLAEAVGEAYLSIYALRSLAAQTVNRLAAGERLGPEISVAKIVLGTTEQTVADTARQLLWPELELEDSVEARNWRRAWAFSRITTIYGGAIEVQRDLVAERLLGLPRGTVTVEAGEQELLRSSACRLLQTAKPAEIARALVDLGWFDLLSADPAAAVIVTAEEQGRLKAATPILDLVMQHAAGVDTAPGTALLLPAPARQSDMSGIESGGGLQVDGVALAGRDQADTWLLLTAAGLVAVPAGPLARAPVAGADPELGLTVVTGQVDRRDADLVAPPAAGTAAVNAGRRWLASELVGLAASMLDQAVAYVSARQQFGRPIATFQTVKHRLADVHVAVTAARAGVATAWADETGLSAMAAKCLGARAHDLASVHGHQVHGGLAFTVEHGFQRWIERGHLLDALLGTRRRLTGMLGETCIEAGLFPRTPDLADLP